MFLNPVAVQQRRGEFRPAIIVRVEHHLGDDPSEIINRMSKTDQRWYHGGGLYDELAALTSLALGIRGKAGGVTRDFDVDSGTDPRGRPIGYAADPVDTPPPRRRVIVRNALARRSLDEIRVFANLPAVSAAMAIAVVRAARLYQDALWISDTDPSLSWVLLVSAVEVAAIAWRRKNDPPVERMRASKPTLEPLLRDYGGDELVQRVAEEIADYMGATRKFREFILKFVPNPPAERPGDAGQHPWDEPTLKSTLDKVYRYRSQALHSGVPFPIPMCEPGIIADGWTTPSEIPVGSAMEASGGTWLQEDTPLLLNTFEYMTRGALLNWWRHSTEFEQ
jgi:hypothetical protein